MSGEMRSRNYYEQGSGGSDRRERSRSRDHTRVERVERVEQEVQLATDRLIQSHNQRGDNTILDPAIEALGARLNDDPRTKAADITREMWQIKIHLDALSHFPSTETDYHRGGVESRLALIASLTVARSSSEVRTAGHAFLRDVGLASEPR